MSADAGLVLVGRRSNKREMAVRFRYDSSRKWTPAGRMPLPQTAKHQLAQPFENGDAAEEYMP
jgi:hypothetical protein